MLPLGGHLLYAVGHGILGVRQASLWFLALCVYYGILAALRCCAVIGGPAAVRGGSARGVFGASGILLLLFGAALAGVNAVSLAQNIATAYPTIPMIAIAAYTAGRVTAAVVRALGRHKDAAPRSVVLRCIGYAEVAASVLTLQRSMLASFGRMDAGQMVLMNALTGAGVCGWILLLGFHMILRAGKEDRQWQNQNS